MTKTNLGLVEFVKSKLALKTIYMLGGFGRILTQAMIDRRINMGCPHTIRNLVTIKAGIGRYCFDCVGLIKGYLWEISPGKVDYNIPKGSDQNVGMMYNNCTQKGVLTSMPDILGLLVFTKDLGHVGVYIGKDTNGKRQYVECTPAWGKWGVCQSNDEIRTWAFWGKYNLIEYVEQAAEPVVPKMKFKAGQRVVLNGRVYRNSLMGGPGAIISNRVGVIRFLVDEDEVPAPYHVSGLGWVKEVSLRPYVAPVSSIYYSVPKYTGNSIVDALKSIGVTTSLSKIAHANGIKLYWGWASQNIKLLSLLKAGKLKKG